MKGVGIELEGNLRRQCDVKPMVEAGLGEHGGGDG